jgi:integrase
MAKALTAKGVENLKPRATRYEQPDGRGLYLITQPSGTKSWGLRYRWLGKPVKLTLGTYPAVSLAQARRLAADALLDLAHGRNPAAAKGAAKAAAELAATNTLRAVGEMYLAREEARPQDKRLRTIGQRRSTLERLVYPKLGGRPISEIRRSEIVALLDDVETKRGGRMADEVLGTLRIVFTWFANRDDNFRSPLVRGMTRTKPKERARSRVLDDDELRRVWVAAEGMGTFGAFLRFTLLTATRRSEAAWLTHSELSNGDWIIPGSRYKNKRDHLIPLSAAARAVLAELPVIVNCDYVFTTDGRNAIGDLVRPKAKLDRLAGVHDWRLHDLRRVARSLLSRAGIAADIAEMCLGHTLTGVRGVYDRHSYRREKAQAFEALAAEVMRIVHPPEGQVLPMRRR